ncbi:MAG: hypothetical protein JSU06_02365 [Actinobacteria bacterium]|nr:hypothetical protein [Actinomycetota bacterium]
MRRLVAILSGHRRAVLIASGLGLALLGLAAPAAHADVWANVGPGRSLSGLKGGWTLGAYELDENFSMISAGVLSGVDVSGFLPMIAFFFANVIWLGTSWFANLLIELFGFAFSLDLVNGSGATGGAGALGPVSRAIQTIYTTAFGGPWMVLAVSVAALWAMWKALVQRRYAETAAQLALSLIYVCAAFFFVLQPGQTIGAASHLTNEMSTAFLSIAKNGEPTSQAEAKEAGADQLFGLLVAQPWAVLEFGGLEHCVKSGSEGDEPESVSVQPLAPSASRGLESGQTVTSGGKTCINNLKKYGPHFLRMPPGSKERKGEVEALEDGDTSKLPDSDPGKENGSYELGPQDEPAAASMEKGGQYQRLLVGFVILLAELGAFFLLGGLSLGVIVAQVELLLMLAFAPVALVAAVVPGRGHQFFKGWLAKLAGLLLRKAAYSLILAILLAVCAAISEATSELGWLFSFGLQCAFFWTVFLRRRSLTDGLIGAVTGPDAPGRDRALSLLALYAGARVGSRTLLRPAARAGRGAGRGLAWAGSTFLGRGRGTGGQDPVAPVRAPGVPLGGKKVHTELGGGRGDADRRDEHRQDRTRWRPERRPGDRAKDPDRGRRRPADRPERPQSQDHDEDRRRPEEGGGRPVRRVPRWRGTGRAGWWRGAGRRGGRPAASATASTNGPPHPRPGAEAKTPQSSATPRRTRPARPEPERRPAVSRRDPQAPDLADALEDDQRRRRGTRPVPPAAKPAPAAPPPTRAVHGADLSLRPAAPGGSQTRAPLSESEYELPILKAYAGERREGGRPVEDSVGELMKARFSDADRAVDPAGGELWTARLRARRRRLLDGGHVSFDPRRRVWGLTERGEARQRELESAETADADTDAGADAEKDDGR